MYKVCWGGQERGWVGMLGRRSGQERGWADVLEERGWGGVLGRERGGQRRERGGQDKSVYTGSPSPIYKPEVLASSSTWAYMSMNSENAPLLFTSSE